VSRELLEQKLEQAVSLPWSGVTTSEKDYLITSDIANLLKELKLYLVIFSMDFLRPAVIIAFLKVPVCAIAFRILQALMTSTIFWLLAKYDNSGKISAATNSCRPSSDF
jgi:hypothetical protein